MADTWPPTRILRRGKIAPTSTNVVACTTDAGKAYVKLMGNPAGEHALAQEWVGTQLAEAMGLTTLTFGLMNYDGTPAIRFPGGADARAGPAFVTRAEKLATLESSEILLASVVNPEDFAKLVVFDTWTLNADRYFPDEKIRHPNRKNVVFSRVGKKGWKLRAMDQSLCFTREMALNVRLGDIRYWQDTKIYGLFPEFRPLVTTQYTESAVAAMLAVDRARIADIVASIPPEWEVSPAVLQALESLLCTRRGFVADNIIKAVAGGWPTLAEPQEGETS